MLSDSKCHCDLKQRKSGNHRIKKKWIESGHFSQNRVANSSEPSKSHHRTKLSREFKGDIHKERFGGIHKEDLNPHRCTQDSFACDQPITRMSIWEWKIRFTFEPNIGNIFGCSLPIHVISFLISDRKSKHPRRVKAFADYRSKSKGD